MTNEIERTGSAEVRAFGGNPLAAESAIGVKNLLPYAISHAPGLFVCIERQWWPLRPTDALPLIEDRHLSRGLMGFGIAGLAAILSGLFGIDESFLGRTLIPATVTLGVIGFGVWHRSRLPAKIVVDAVDRVVRVDSTVVPFTDLKSARPRIIASNRRDEGQFDVRLTLPSQQLLLGRFGAREEAQRLVAVLEAVLTHGVRD